MSITIQNFDNEANFTHDNTQTEFPGSNAQLKSQIPAGATFGANYTQDENGIWGQGDLTGLLKGDAVISNGRARIVYAFDDDTNIEYDATGKINPHVGEIKINYIPLYAGNPTQAQVIYDFREAEGNNRNRMAFLHQTNGTFRMFMWDNAGVSSYIQDFALVALTQNAINEIVVNWDHTPTSEAQRLFIAGNQNGATATNASTNDDDTTSVTFIRHGSDQSVERSNFEIDDPIYHTSVLATANYTPGYSVNEELNIVGAKISPNAGTTMDELVSFAAVTTGQVAFVTKIGSNFFYHDDVDWVAADGESFDMANTVAEINTNKATLPISNGPSVRFEPILKSIDGSTNSTITSQTFDSNYLDQQDVKTCRVYGYVVDNDKNVVTANVLFKTNDGLIKINANSINVNIKDQTDALGYFDVSVPVSGATPVTLTFDYKDSLGVPVNEDVKILIPDQDTVAFDDDTIQVS